MRFATGHTHPPNVISIANNGQEDRHSPTGGDKVTSMKPTPEKPGDSIPANSAEEARVISVDEDSDGEALAIRVSKKQSLHRAPLLAIPSNPGSEGGHESETQCSISQEVGLSSDTTGMVL
jgi:hypothetical protein